MGRLIRDLTNKKFDKLLVIEKVSKNKYGHIIWKCKCDCGNFKLVSGENLKSLKTKSCGCYNKELTAQRNFKHGHNTRENTSIEYTAWSQMIGRCYNVNNTRYKNYGGRGIKVCDKWLNDFNAFLSDIGVRPTIQHSLDRIDVNKDYSPENCRWATDIEQARNRTNNHWIEYNGEKRILTDWANLLKVPHSNFSKMLKTKSFEQAYKYYTSEERRKPRKVKINE